MKIQVAPKLLSVWAVRRRIQIPALQSAADAALIKRALAQVPGSCETLADTRKHRILLCYDAARVDYRSIAKALTKAGYPPSSDPWTRMKARWYQYTDTNARDNANAPSAPCCNKPPK
ncbi:MAG: hypothetical protein ABFS23_13930 [Pseudomonadota bacterium]